MLSSVILVYVNKNVLCFNYQPLTHSQQPAATCGQSNTISITACVVIAQPNTIKAETAPKKNLESAHLQKNVLWVFVGGLRCHHQQQQQHFFADATASLEIKIVFRLKSLQIFTANAPIGFVEAHPGLKQFEPALKKINNASS